MEKKININFDNKEIIGDLSLKSKNKDDPIILLIHGFGATRNNKSVLTAKLFFDSINISTLRIDLFNHGESTGDFVDMTVTNCINSIKESINFLISENYKNIGVFASSMGGLATSFAILNYLDEINFLLLKSPVSINQGDIIANYYKLDKNKWETEGFIEWINRIGIKTKLNYNFYEDAQKYNFNSISDKIKIPTLIVHGDKDSFVPIEGTKKLHSNIKKSTLRIIAGCDHFYTKGENEELFKYIKEFLLNNKIIKV